jgi:hypothetical protein
VLCFCFDLPKGVVLEAKTVLNAENSPQVTAHTELYNSLSSSSSSSSTSSSGGGSSSGSNLAVVVVVVVVTCTCFFLAFCSPCMDFWPPHTLEAAFINKIK